MAFYISKSRKYFRHFNQKFGFQAMIDLSCRSSYFPPEYYSVSENSRIPHLLSCNRPTLFTSRRFESIKPDKQLDYVNDSGGPQVLNFPGGIVKFTQELKFLSESTERIPCYRVLDDRGQLLSNNCVQIDKNIAVKMYKDMVMLQTMDSIFYEVQRQGRISFYVTSIGEEAINIASAAALTMDDFIFPQVTILNSFYFYSLERWKHDQLCSIGRLGFFFLGDLHYKISLTSVLETNSTTEKEGRCQHIMDPRSTIISLLLQQLGERRYLCISIVFHYLIFNFTLQVMAVIAPISTQVLHAVGAAYALKMEGKDACTITYFGDGDSSTGDFHAALNFAAVMEAPVILFCRNNGWAISTPVSDQFRSDGVVVRGQAYGVRSFRVDGNDALAVFNTVHVARKMAINESRPILIEALTYRAGHHSTSDDSSKYRPIEDIEWWRLAQDPVARFRKWLEGDGWWDSQAESELREATRNEVLHAIQIAEKIEKPGLQEIFSDVYDVPSPNLCHQEKSLREMVKRHQQDYPPDVPY